MKSLKIFYVPLLLSTSSLPLMASLPEEPQPNLVLVAAEPAVVDLKANTLQSNLHTKYRQNGHKPESLAHHLPETHPALRVEELATPFEQCERLLQLAKQEADHETALLLSQWGKHIAYEFYDDKRCFLPEKIQKYIHKIERLSAKKQRDAWGDKEWGDYDDRLRFNKKGEYKNPKTLEQLQGLVQVYNDLKARMKELYLAHETICAATCLALAGLQADHRETWYKRSIRSFLKLESLEEISQIWPIIRQFYEDLYDSTAIKNQGCWDEDVVTYEGIIGLLCKNQLPHMLAGKIGLAFLPENHFLRKAMLTEDPRKRIEIIRLGLSQKHNLSNLLSLRIISGYMILQASKQIHAQEQSAESRQILLKGFEEALMSDSSWFSWHSYPHIGALKEVTIFTKDLDLADIPPTLIKAISEKCSKHLSEDQGPIYEVLDPSEIQRLRQIFLKETLIRRVRDSKDYSPYYAEAAFPVGHPARETMKLKAMTPMGYDVKLLKAKRLYELSQAEVDPETKLLLLLAAKYHLGQTFYKLEYETKPFNENKTFLEIVSAYEIFFSIPANVKEELQELWEDFFEGDLVDNMSRNSNHIIHKIRSSIGKVHSKSMATLSRSEKDIPEAAALKKAYKRLQAGSTNWVRSEDLDKFQVIFEDYNKALKAFCDLLWGMRDSINREILGLFLTNAENSEAKDKGLWQLRSALFAQAIRAKTLSSTDIKLLKEEFSKQDLTPTQAQLAYEASLFSLATRLRDPVVLNNILLARLAKVWLDLMEYTKTHKLSDSVSKELMDILPKDIAQVGDSFITAHLEPQGCTAYFSAQMAQEHILSTLIDAQERGDPIENLQEKVGEYFGTIQRAIEAFYRPPVQGDFFLHLICSMRFDSNDAASNIVALRMAHETEEFLCCLQAYVKEKGFAIPISLAHYQATLRDQAVKIVEELKFGRFAGDDAKYFQAQSYFKISTMFDDPISRLYFQLKGAALLGAATYKDDMIPDAGRMVRAFDVRRNKPKIENTFQAKRLKVASYAMEQCLLHMASAVESALFMALDYKCIALALNKELCEGGEAVLTLDARVQELEARSLSHVHSLESQEDLARLAQSYVTVKNNIQQMYPYASKLEAVKLSGSNSLNSILFCIAEHRDQLSKR